MKKLKKIETEMDEAIAPILEKRGGTSETKTKKKTTLETSFIESDGEIFEQIITENSSQFLTLNGNKAKFYDVVDGFRPIDDNAVKKGVVMLPTGIEEYGTTKILLDDVQKFIHKWLDVSPLFEKISAQYILLTWVYDKLYTIVYLRPIGDTGTGKTRFLDVVGRLCYKSIMISGAVTPAPIYRLIEKWKGTLIIDEADMKDTGYYNEVITILNCGFEKGKPVIRCDKDKPNELEFFDPFCPKLIATRNKFKDKALESRCLSEVMKETYRKIPTTLTKEFFEEQKILRNKLLLFRFKMWDKINPKDVLNLDLGEIEPRLKQAMSSVAVLFIHDEKMMKEFKKFLKEYQKDLIEERASSYDGKIVNIIYGLFESGKTELSSKDISEKMNDEYPLGEGKKHSPITIGRHIKTLGLGMEVKRIEEKIKRIINLDKKNKEILVKLFKRYVSVYIQDVTDVSNVTDVTDTYGRFSKNKKG